MPDGRLYWVASWFVVARILSIGPYCSSSFRASSSEMVAPSIRVKMTDPDPLYKHASPFFICTHVVLELSRIASFCLE